MGRALHTPGPGGTGLVTAAEARLDDAGLLAVGASGSASARTGVLPSPNAAALVSGTSATGTMTYAIAAHHWVTSRGTVADGVYRGAAETAQMVPTSAAPGSGSRIDVIWVKQNDQTSTLTPDADSAVVYGVTQGTVGGGKPTIPVGAEELATATVPAGVTRTDTGVTITQTARFTVARGAPVPVRTKAERDALDKYVGLTVKRLDLGGREQRWTGSAWAEQGDVPVLADIAARTAYFSGELRAGASALVAGKLHVYDGTAWRFRLAFDFAGTTDANGLLNVAHGAGQAPTAWNPGLRSQVTDALSQVIKVLGFSADATNLVVRAYRTDTSTTLGAQPIQGTLWAEF